MKSETQTLKFVSHDRNAPPKTTTSQPENGTRRGRTRRADVVSRTSGRAAHSFDSQHDLFLCWFISDRIYNFLARPVQRALAEAQQQRRVTMAGQNGELSTVPLNSLKANDRLRFVFPDATRLGPAAIPAGASVLARVDFDKQGNVGLFTDEPLTAGNEVVPKDVRLPVDFNKGDRKSTRLNS